ncbi:branched-chain amino acid ABC transporter permease [Halomarina halobia]|uniref:Branched-chain amino acid ABC transporter permease n=1 Tax=Halomarina halobia TaxID=3033386 RepID=A0ABD6AE91_9EURY|nr:branched-chain amino acid ABC transporter permease [Halomarina sp. PSR21]
MSRRASTGKERIRQFVNGTTTVPGWRADLLVIASLGMLVLIMPVVAETLMGFRGVAANVLIWMLFAVAFNLLLGYAGLLSFGHAMFFGGGMYVLAITMRELGPVMIVVGAPLALLSMGLLAYVIARLIAEKGEIYFALLTIAFGELVWYIGNSNPGGLTGGNDGLSSGMLPPFVEAFRGNLQVVVGSVQVDIYWAVALLFVVGVFLLYRIVRSPFGRTLLTIKENEQLARSIGVNTYRYKVHTFVISAIFTAAAGCMLVVVNQSVATSQLTWHTSGEVVIMSILGGINTFAGPMFGVFLWFLAEESLSGLQAIGELRHFWQFGLGLLFVTVILVAPRTGGYGAIKGGIRRIANELLGGK